MKERVLIIYLYDVDDNIKLKDKLRKYVLDTEYKVDLLVSSHAAKEVWENNPYINHVFVYPFPPPRFWNIFKYWHNKKRVWIYVNEFLNYDKQYSKMFFCIFKNVFLFFL